MSKNGVLSNKSSIACSIIADNRKLFENRQNESYTFTTNDEQVATHYLVVNAERFDEITGARTRYIFSDNSYIEKFGNSYKVGEL